MKELLLLILAVFAAFVCFSQRRDSIHYAGNYWPVRFDTIYFMKVIPVPDYYYVKGFSKKQEREWIRKHGYDTITASLQEYNGRWFGFFGSGDSSHIIIRK